MMYLSPEAANVAEIHGLVAACAQNEREPALGRFIKLHHWEQLAEYLHADVLTQAQVLIKQGASERTLYFLERGSLSVHFEDASGKVRLAIVGPGSAVGEGGFFSHQPRNATVQAASPGRIWSLTPIRFTELSTRAPETALALTLALGALISQRMVDRRKRISVT